MASNVSAVPPARRGRQPPAGRGWAPWATLSARAVGTSVIVGVCPKARLVEAKVRQRAESAVPRAREYIIGYNSPLYRSDEADRGQFTRPLLGAALNRHSRSAA